ncbi:MAG: TerC family protein [Desulfobacterota bacterium]|nr:TerC family protein [Thermodesulfobacteriota bacterium]
MIIATEVLWGGFIIFVLGMLALDLGVFHRNAHVVSLREALIWCATWVSLALIFNLGILFFRGGETALTFFTGYLIEYSLSVDNIFVFLLIFRYFRVPTLYQHKVLFWGILGALIMRAIFIFMGITLIQRFHWMVLVFGIFLVVSGIKMAFQKDKEIHPEKNLVLRLFRKIMPVTGNYEEDKFFLKKEKTLFATPLFIVLLVVETTDVVFALDSVPAVLAITRDPFIVYTSNVFAILGLRALFFALAGIMRLFHYLHYGLSVILVFVGIKMIIADFYPIPTVISLGVIGSILFISIALSLLKPSSDK